MKNRINHQNDVICLRKVYNKCRVSIGRKTLKTSLKYGVIITIGATGIFLGLKTLNVVKPPKTSKLDAMDIMMLTAGICGGVFAKDYAL